MCDSTVELVTGLKSDLNQIRQQRDKILNEQNDFFNRFYADHFTFQPDAYQINISDSEEEEEPFIDEDDFDINDGESEEEFEEMTDKKDVADKDRPTNNTDISDWIKNMFPEDLKKAFKKTKMQRKNNIN